MNYAVTSTTLLREIAGDAAHPRWGEFVVRYRPMMEAYMRERFPAIEADDVIQETLVAIVRALPTYRYSPDETGAFHNYLTGILRHKALDALNRSRRRSDVMTGYVADVDCNARNRGEDLDEAWRDAVFKIALGQFFADESVQDRTKEIFKRVAINGEKPEDVAEAFGMTRNAVDQIKARSASKLKELVNALEDACDATLGHV